MKHLIVRSLASLTLAIAGLAVAAPAQSTQAIKVNIPFEFNFGTQTFPAGDYSLVEPLQHFLVLRDARGRSIAQRFTAGIHSPAPAEETTLKFASRDGVYSLTEVWQQDDSSGQQLYQAKYRPSVAKQHSPDNRETAGAGQP
jgi:hypothetical protein